MKFKFIAPFHTNFDLHTFKIISDGQAYNEFWQNIKEHLHVDYPYVQFLHYIDIDQKNEQKFTAITEDANTLPAEALLIKEGHLKGYFQQAITSIQKDEALSPELKNVTYVFSECRIYDNQISILELDVEIPFTADGLMHQITKLQHFSNRLMEIALGHFYGSFLENFFQAVCKIVQKQTNVDNFLDEPKVTGKQAPAIFWVNRSLHLSKKEANVEAIAENWLSISNNTLENIVEDLNKQGLYLGWGHNIIYAETDEEKVRQAIDAMHLCQYYNAVLEIYNTELTGLIGASFLSNKVNKTTKVLSKKLNQMLADIKIILIQLNEAKYNLQDYKQYYFLDLYNKWKIEKIKQNIEEKMKLSHDKIQEIYQRQSKRNQFIMEIILFGIGGIALIDFFSSISLYAFYLNTTEYKPWYYPATDIPGFINLANILAPNGMIWFGGILLIITFVLFTILRFRSR